MLLTYLFNIFCREQEKEDHDTFIMHNLGFDISVLKKDYYHGHSGEDFDFLKDLKPIDHGFNAIFRALKSEISVSTNHNVVNVNINRNTDHFTKNSKYEFTISGGELYDVFVEEIIRSEVVHSVLQMRIKESGTEGY